MGSWWNHFFAKCALGGISKWMWLQWWIFSNPINFWSLNVRKVTWWLGNEMWTNWFMLDQLIYSLVYFPIFSRHAWFYPWSTSLWRVARVPSFSAIRTCPEDAEGECHQCPGMVSLREATNIHSMLWERVDGQFVRYDNMKHDLISSCFHCKKVDSLVNNWSW